MIIVAGWIRIHAGSRAAFLESCRAVIASARSAPGCHDFCTSPDLVDPERVNVFELWESVEDLDRFRESGPSDEQQALIVRAHVVQYEVISSALLT